MLQHIGSISPRYQRLILLLLCAILYGFWWSRVPLLEVDEVRYVESTREMFETHDFLIPHYRYEPRYAKPILYYWVQSAAVAAFGQNEITVRLPSALLGLLLVLMVHAFLLRLLGREIHDREHGQLAIARGAAFLGAAGLAVLPLLAPWTRLAATDITLTFFITSSLLAIVLAELEPATARRWYLLAAVAAALAFLTKGPMGIVIPGVVWLIYHVRQRSLWAEMRRVPWIGMIGIVLLINLPWYIATLFVKDGHGFLQKFFLTENAGRFATNMQGRNSFGQRFSALIIFLLGSVAVLFPLNAFLARDLVMPFNGDTSAVRDTTTARLRRFAWIWLTTVIAFIALSQTRGLNYIQGGSAAAAILFAIHLVTRFAPASSPASPRKRITALLLERIMLVFFGTVLLGGTAYLVSRESPVLDRRAWQVAFPATMSATLTTIMLAAGVIYLGILAYGWIRRSDEIIVGGVVLHWTLYLGILLLGVVPMYFTSLFGPVRDVGLYLRDIERDRPVLTYMTACPVEPENPEGLTYYARRKVDFHSSKDRNPVADVMAAVTRHREILLVTDWKGLDEMSRVTTPVVLKRFPFFIVARLTPGIRLAY